MSSIIRAASLGSGPDTTPPERQLPVFIDQQTMPNLAYLLRCASIADPQVPVTMYCTAAHWGELVRELCNQPKEIWVDPDGPRPTPATFKRMQLTKNFAIENAGTDDQVAIDRLNRLAEYACSWRQRHDRFAQRAGEKKLPEATEARSTWKDALIDPTEVGF